MRFVITGSKKKILLLSCENGMSRALSYYTSDNYDIASSNSVPSIIENERYLNYRLFVIDVDNDPDGGFNLVRTAMKSYQAQNMDFILLSTVPYSDDIESISKFLPNPYILTKPFEAKELYQVIVNITKSNNQLARKNIRTYKHLKDVQLLKDAETNLFNKNSFIAKFNQFIETNKKLNNHVMIFGIDNLDIYNALYEDEKTNKLISHISKKLSSPVIPLSARYAFDKIAMVVNGDAKTCQNIFNEIQIHASSFDTKYPLIMHAGICEIFPLESDAQILCYHALAAYTLAKYSECDYVLPYDGKTKFKLWNGVDSIYNTNVGDISVSSENSNINEKPIKKSNVQKTSKEEPKQLSFDDFVVDSGEVQHTNEYLVTNDDYDFFDDPLPTIDSEEDRRNNHKDNSLFNKPLDNRDDDIFLDENDDLLNFNTTEIEPINIPSFKVDKEESNEKDSSIEEPIEQKENKEIDEKPVFTSSKKQKTNNIPSLFDTQLDDSNNETVDSNRYSAIDTFKTKENDERTKEEERIANDIESQHKSFSESIVDSLPKSNKNINYLGADIFNQTSDEEAPKDTRSENETKTLSIFDSNLGKKAYEKVERKHIEIKTLSVDEFTQKTNSIIKNTSNHNAFYYIVIDSDVDDNDLLNEFIYEKINEIFNKDACICNVSKCNYTVFLDGDFDEKSAKKYANDFIMLTQGQRFGTITCKIGIGISSPKATSVEAVYMMARVAYDKTKKMKGSMFNCKSIPSNGYTN